MTCEELLRQLAAYEDGALPDEMCTELQRHLAGCETCQGLRADLEALARICRGCEPPRLPAAVRRRLMERIGAPPR
jgi:anti-sigma factor (TIGR02949 family)